VQNQAKLHTEHQKINKQASKLKKKRNLKSCEITFLGKKNLQNMQRDILS